MSNYISLYIANTSAQKENQRERNGQWVSFQLDGCSFAVLPLKMEPWKEYLHVPEQSDKKKYFLSLQLPVAFTSVLQARIKSNACQRWQMQSQRSISSYSGYLLQTLCDLAGSTNLLWPFNQLNTFLQWFHHCRLPICKFLLSTRITLHAAVPPSAETKSDLQCSATMTCFSEIPAPNVKTIQHSQPEVSYYQT